MHWWAVVSPSPAAGTSAHSRALARNRKCSFGCQCCSCVDRKQWVNLCVCVCGHRPEIAVQTGDATFNHSATLAARQTHRYR